MARERTEPLYLDIHIPPGTQYDAHIDSGANAFAYVYEGTIAVGEPGRSVETRSLALLTNTSGADGVSLRTESGGRVLVIAGKPVGEPIVQYGPFVMNTMDELDQAIADHRAGLF